MAYYKYLFRNCRRGAYWVYYGGRSIAREWWVIENRDYNRDSFLELGDKSTNEEIKVFPNPMNTSAMITFPNKNQTRFLLSLYDTQGRVVRTLTDISTGEVQLEKGDLLAGIYHFCLTSKDQQVFTGQLIIE